jgi:DNA-binding MarR family transcriptional regulator/GNAT superfamily N-acetyltransferase
MAELVDTVAAVRRFNRFYTRAIGALERSFLGGPYSLPETRVLWEIAHADGITPKAVGAALGLDPGYLSRMLARLERDGLVARERAAADGRSILLTLTDHGRAVFGELDQRQAQRVEALMGPLSADGRGRLAAAVAEVEDLLDGATRPPVVLRDPRVGDMGWVVERHAVLYHREYGWTGMEPLVGRIVADFVETRDPARERCWIAERAGQRLGCVFLVKETDDVARLRLLLLEPAARGERLGRRLVDECIRFAREAGYREIVLWTHAKLTAARGIYAATGFRLEETWTHDDFGQAEVSETWRLPL